MPDITLVGLEQSVYTRIARLVLEEKGIAYEIKEVDIFTDDGPPATYLALHPFGRIPCLIHGELILYETAAITRYIDEQFDGPTLQPAQAVLRARMNQVIGVFDSYSYRPMVWDVYVQQVELPKYGESPDQNVIAAALQQTETVLTELESWLGESDFLAGNALSLADLHGLPMLDCFGRAPDGKTLLGGYPLVTQWLDRMTARKSAKSIL